MFKKGVPDNLVNNIIQFEMEKYFSSDRPISNQIDDRFQRYGFAKRIADTIFERENEDCIVIGIYGAWGEGKTSIINFIDTELQGKENVITIKFNPWRYNDEDSLLKQFFLKLAIALDTNLKNKKEEAGKFLKKYGKFLNIDIPLFGNVGEMAQSLGEILDNTNIESLKERLEDILKENNSKIVIFIDDIDRLDKDEIHSIFRLVKLTADFSNITYILSFDEEMVSEAIGKQFGSGDTKSGQLFLEKIIQVPLKIPVAQPEALKHFCFELVDKAISLNNIKLTEEEERRFVNEFTSNVLIKIDTPRLAIRYGNTLSFSMPLLFGEVNIVDLMLIEAIKIFYPSHYKFIKSNPEYFTESFLYITGVGNDREKIDSLELHFKELGKDLSKKQNDCVRNLLQELFPYLNTVFNNITYSDEIINNWYKNKRIVMPEYFNKYFSYSIIKGELSDISFQNFIINITNQNLEEIVNSINTLINQSSPYNFLNKLTSVINDLDWDASIKIAKGISFAPEVFPKQGNSFLFRFNSPYERSALCIYQLIKKHTDTNEQFKLAKELITETKTYEFAIQLINWFRFGKTDEQKIFTKDQVVELSSLLIAKALMEANGLPVFEKFPDHCYYLFNLWAEKDKEDLTKYINNILNKDPQKCINLLRSYTQNIRTEDNESKKADFSKEQYQSFITIFDKIYINNMITKSFTDKELNTVEVKWTQMGNNQTDLNIIRQFRHWLNESMGATES